jgi:hypothetical protein
VADQGSPVQEPAPPAGTAWEIEGDPTAAEMIKTGEAAALIGRGPRTIERWIDAGILAGGRPTDPSTGQHIKNTHRWVDARHAVAIAVGAGRGHLVPEKWRYLIPQTFLPAPRSGDSR